MRGIARAVFSLTCLLGLSSAVTAQEPGTVVPDFAVKDIRYLSRAWSDFGAGKVSVLAFVALQDPATTETLAGLAALRKELDEARAVVAVVSVGTEDSVIDAATAGLRAAPRLTVLKDRLGEAAHSLGVTTTPAAVVLDAERTLLYRGPLAGAAEAARAALAGQAVAPRAEPLAGRALVVRSVPDAPGVNYAEHVAPIMNKYCVECHHTGSGTPFTLISYSDVANKANMIREVVLDGRMPPWYGASAHTDFINRRQLSTAEQDIVEQWIRAGKPQGDLAKAPALPPLPSSAWEIDDPDLVLQIPEESSLPATGFVPYKYVALPYQFPADTWIQGLQILPSNKAVVHHANIIYSVDGKFQEESQFLTGYVPGGRPVMLAGPLAMLVPKGAVLMLQIHYVTTGKPEVEQMRVGIRYAKANVNKRVYFQRIRPANDDLNIPPHDPAWRISADWTFDRNATALALFTHMHVRGRDMEFLADYPDGRAESLLLVPNYNFDWQLPYLYLPGAKQIPKGTKITTVSHYDNSAFNPYNPDPNATVPYGDQTIHEMNDAYIFFLDNDETLDIAVDPATGQATRTGVASAK